MIVKNFQEDPLIFFHWYKSTRKNKVSIPLYTHTWIILKHTINPLKIHSINLITNAYWSLIKRNLAHWEPHNHLKILFNRKPLQAIIWKKKKKKRLFWEDLLSLSSLVTVSHHHSLLSKENPAVLVNLCLTLHGDQAIVNQFTMSTFLKYRPIQFLSFMQAFHYIHIANSEITQNFLLRYLTVNCPW